MAATGGREDRCFKLTPFCVAALVSLISGCSSSQSNGPIAPDADDVFLLGNLPAPSNTQLKSPTNLDPIEELVYSESYSGSIGVIFSDVRREQDVGYDTESRDSVLEEYTRHVRDTSRAYPSAGALTRRMGESSEEIDMAREELELKSATRLFDWNLSHYIQVSNPDDAVNLMRELRKLPKIERVYPIMRSVLGSVTSTPSLTGLQDYLYSEKDSGGLNALAAWNYPGGGVFGENVFLIDAEKGINPNHEDLAFVADDLANGGIFYFDPSCSTITPPDEECQPNIAHGTAVAGILAGKHNDYGISGFAPKASFVHAQTTISTFSPLISATDGVGDDDIEPGSVWLIEEQLPGKLSKGSKCTNGEVGDASAECEYGMIPTEAWPEDFLAIKQAVAYGITVVSIAGNGQMNLDNPDLYGNLNGNVLHDLTKEDTGAIMVGASEGSNKKRAFFSNCGIRVNTFAWGGEVVSTAYPFGLYKWSNPTGPTPPNKDENSYYMDNFGGTSSAAAMVAGSAALVQSYARKELGGYKRYLTPQKMREIISASGVVQSNKPDCNIGKQPRLDNAFLLVNDFITKAQQDYPHLTTKQTLTLEEMAALRNLGVGIICTKGVAQKSDPICPDNLVFTIGSKESADLDFDGDGRADLVHWTNGSWKLDLSNVGQGDSFGEWDTELEFLPIDSKWLVPYTVDLNSDGRTDFVVYDKENGKWYGTYTTSNIVYAGLWHGWDFTIDYSDEWKDDLNLNPEESHYSRPAAGDYNGDGFVDIAIACSDGFWRIDYGGLEPSSFGSFDTKVKYLSDAELLAAPGWAYLTSSYYYMTGGSSKPRMFISYKVPDGLPDEGKLVILQPTSYQKDIAQTAPHIFGGNESIPLFGRYNTYPSSIADFGIKSNDDASWYVTKGSLEKLTVLQPLTAFGGPECHPANADFDGDKITDRAVMCPNGWRIDYSSNKYADYVDPSGIRHIPLPYDLDVFTLPGRSYSGGTSYQSVLRMIEEFSQLNPGEPPPIPVDMDVVSQ